MGSAILIAVTLHGQVVFHADAMVTTWDRCSELALDINTNGPASMEAFCTSTDGMTVGGITGPYLEGGE
jgi:hypothetical protein